MTIDFIALEHHHAVHGRAIYDALPPELRGKFYTTARKAQSDTVAVFSYAGLKDAARNGKKAIFCEHGVGMFYNVDHPSYAGSKRDRECVVLRLSPNEIHARKERETLQCPVEVVGVPYMDRYAGKTYARNDPPVVAFSFHFDCRVVPETRSAWQEFIKGIRGVTKRYRVIGHGHPRIIQSLLPAYHMMDVPVVRQFDEVLEQADLYVCDNSSTIYQFAFTGKPVVLMNSRHYRRELEHIGNPRFWRHADIGPSANEEHELLGAIDEAFANDAIYAPRRKRYVREMMGFTDGHCAQRAARAIVKHAKRWEFERSVAES